MELFNELGIDIGYVVIGMAGVILFEFLLIIITMAKNSKTRKKYNSFMGGKNAKDLENVILEKFAAVDRMDADVKKAMANMEVVNKQLVGTYQKMGLVKYDAFKEVGGKLSFVLVLLTADDNGVIINSMHSTRDGCYTYAKQVENGEAFVILSEEEQQALDEAKKDIMMSYQDVDK